MGKSILCSPQSTISFLFKSLIVLAFKLHFWFLPDEWVWVLFGLVWAPRLILNWKFRIKSEIIAICCSGYMRPYWRSSSLLLPLGIDEKLLPLECNREAGETDAFNRHLIAQHLLCLFVKEKHSFAHLVGYIHFSSHTWSSLVIAHWADVLSFKKQFQDMLYWHAQ